MKIIAGLGNPGKVYLYTRHNMGFNVLDYLSKKWRIKIKQKRFHSIMGEGVLANKEFILVKPMTMMNESGKAIKKVLSFYGIDSSDLLVICDDFNIPLGVLKFKRNGSSGGHRGLQSIIDELGTVQFARLRLGIGAPPQGEDASDYVLNEFFVKEREGVEEMIVRAVRATEIYFKQGIEKAMQWSNRRAVC